MASPIRRVRPYAAVATGTLVAGSLFSMQALANFAKGLLKLALVGSVLTALMWTRHGRGKRFSDVSDNASYWYFVILAWLPIYAIVYWLPRWGA